VARYNAAARQVMAAAGVPVHDLHAIVTRGGAEALLGADGTHYTPAGYELLAAAVTDSVTRHLTVRSPRPLARPRSGPPPASLYRMPEAEPDAQSPPAYKNLPVPRFEPPADAAAWQRRRPEVLKAVEGTLGDWPPRPSPPRARLVSRELWPGFA